MTKNYSQLIKLKTFEERFEYLKIHGVVGRKVFGEDRFVNQMFYTSSQWRDVRDYVIVRDKGFDLGCEDYPIASRIIIHHMNPITVDEILHSDPKIIDPELLISTSSATHLAIHYGDANLLPKLPMERKPGDTKLW